MFWSNYLVLCNRINKSPTTVAHDVGINSSGTVAAWKRGAVPRDAMLHKIAGYFGVTVSDLLGDGIEEKSPPTATDGRTVNDADIMAAFWGGDADLSGEDVAALWADARDYIAYKTEQLKKRKKEHGTA